MYCSAIAAGEHAAAAWMRCLAPLDARAWNPAALHEAAPRCAPAALAPTSPHALRCCLLGLLLAAARHDAGAPGGCGGLFAAPGGAGRARCEGLLRAVAAGARLPSAGGGGATASGGVPGGAAGFAAFREAYLLPLVSAGAAAARGDALWKPLLGGLLLLTREPQPRVRLVGLRAAGALYAAGGSDALVLLPETLPFLAEVLGDADGGVAAAAGELLRELEAASGEDLAKFL